MNQTNLDQSLHKSYYWGQIEIPFEMEQASTAKLLKFEKVFQILTTAIRDLLPNIKSIREANVENVNEKFPIDLSQRRNCQLPEGFHSLQMQTF